MGFLRSDAQNFPLVRATGAKVKGVNASYFFVIFMLSFTFQLFPVYAAIMSEKKINRHWQMLVDIDARGMRLDKFWAGILGEHGVSRGRVQEWIVGGYAEVDGEVETRGKRKLVGFEAVSIAEPEHEVSPYAPAAESGPLPVLYEDAHVLVVDKPAGLTSHPAPGCPDNTLVNRLLHYWPDIAGEQSGMDSSRPGIVHRLDKDTSGVMVVARTEADRLTLSTAFADRAVCKVYLAIVHGCPKATTGEITEPIGRHPTVKTRMAVVDKGGREARSKYETIWTDPLKRVSLVAVRIFTGRTHQIRVHMAHIGHPLVGDTVYGDAVLSRALLESTPGLVADRQMLHAFFLRFSHPASGKELEFLCPPPPDFLQALTLLNQQCLRIGLVGMPGSGKSTVLRLLQDEGIAVFSADSCVASLYKAGRDGAEMIRKRFGGQFSCNDGSVDKTSLFAAMLESDAVRREVMDIIHPMVQHACAGFFEQHSTEAFAVAEVPLLLEGGWHTAGLVDEVVYVDCPETLRTGKFRESRGLSSETLAVFDSWQWAAEDKKSCCSFLVENNGSLAALQVEVQHVLQRLRAKAQVRNTAHESWLNTLWREVASRFGAGQ